MKQLVYTLFIVISVQCNAQIKDSLFGCWLPENYVKAKVYGRTKDIGRYLQPVEGFEISEKANLEFIKDYHTTNEKVPTDSIILIKTYNSETNSIFVKEIIINNLRKYELPYICSYFNLKFFGKDILKKYDRSKFYISKKQSRLQLEIVDGKKVEYIYFVNNSNGKIFTSI